MTLVVTVVGEVRASHLKLRSAARCKDVIAITGSLGASKAGFDVLRGAVALPEAHAAQAIAAHRRPSPRLKEGRWLAASRHVHAMMDISDGLSTDLSRLCGSSGLGAVLEDVPVAPSAQAAAQALGVDPRSYALAGGEEYELLVAIDPRAFGYLSRKFQAAFGRELQRAGVFEARLGLHWKSGASELPLEPSGWDAISSG